MAVNGEEQIIDNNGPTNIQSRRTTKRIKIINSENIYSLVMGLLLLT